MKYPILTGICAAVGFAATSVNAAEPGRATWNSSLGLVETTGGSASPAQPSSASKGTTADKDKPATATSTSVMASSASAYIVEAFGGLDTMAQNDGIFPVFGGTFGYQHRHLRSLFAPWVRGSFSATLANEDSDLTVYDFGVRGGLDVHPARISYIALGPLVGYRGLIMGSDIPGRPTPPGAGSILQGVDYGLQVHVRSTEDVGDSGVDRPIFEGTVYGYLQSVGLGSVAESNRAFVGTQVSLGGAVRFLVNVEGCVSDSDTCFPRQFRSTAGIGGMW